jgi:hypothetical protein
MNKTIFNRTAQALAIGVLGSVFAAAVFTVVVLADDERARELS